MRLASVAGRATILCAPDDRGEVRGIDIAQVSGGQFGPAVGALYHDWDRFCAWAADVHARDGDPVGPSTLGNPAPDPRQVFAIGLNYHSHAAEAGMDATRGIVPPTFTKFASCLADPFADLVLPSSKVDWEAELVVVIGRHANAVSRERAWSHVAGLAVGQDYSERRVQAAGPAPQFSLGKSFPGFGPIGPWLLTPDELDSPDDLEIVCEINGEQVQRGRTSAMVWPVPDLISALSAVCPLLPGDVIFTGTPAGVGAARSPQRFLRSDDVLVTRIEGIGQIRQQCRSAT
jgi:2-keto-4-pentenoate hydratase/2-oxohepta-3-ene-1,7-dioic acid hydratase in catechol pathway